MQKLISRKNILKEAGVLLVVSILVLTSIVITGQPTQMNEKENKNITWLSSAKTNIFEMEGNSQKIEMDESILPLAITWLHYDDGTNYNAIGLTTGGTWEWAIRLTPTELGPYDGCTLTTVKFHHGYVSGSPSTNSGNIKIYDAGGGGGPGSLLTPPTPWSHTGTGWFDIPLSSPVTIDDSKDLWVSVECVNQLTGEYPAGHDNGPAIDTKGDWIYLSGAWEEIQVYGLDYNWNLWAGVECGNNPPVAVDDTYSVCFASTTIFNVLDNDNDPDGDTITISSVGTANLGTPTIVSGGTAIQYVHTSTTSGSDSFTYQIIDGALTASATVYINICCIEIVDISTIADSVQVKIKNHCGMNLKLYLFPPHDDRVILTWEFTIDPVAPCCGGAAYLTEPSGPGPLVYSTTNRLPNCPNGATKTQKCKVKGNACFTLKLTALVPPIGCSCDTIVKGCVSDLTLCS